MILDPQKTPVEVLSGADLRDATVSITLTGYTGETPRFNLNLLDGVPVAASESARALSRWAFDRGALRVRSDFDLRFER